jgi:hypothetical protein
MDDVHVHVRFRPREPERKGRRMAPLPGQKGQYTDKSNQNVIRVSHFEPEDGASIYVRNVRNTAHIYRTSKSITDASAQ